MDNPPPSKLLRSKLAFVSSRRKNSKNLYLNVKSSSVSPPKSPNRNRPNTSMNDFFPQPLHYDREEEQRRPSTALSINIPEENTVTVTSDLVSPTDRNEDAYPDGPLLVCPPNVYLYSEPSVDIANQYDVVINVAKEVGNPFNTLMHSSSDESSSTCSSPIDNPPPSCSPPSSVESTPDLSVSPTKPWDTHHEPEYIYVPWDHNSKLVHELRHLTDLIEQRTSVGKKVLVHCQCGVSRSASLVVAYVMRKFGWDLNVAYDYVKDRSPNISPNMTLMFQLVDWQQALKDNAFDDVSSSSSSATIV